MTPPTGFVEARRVSGVVKVTERVLPDVKDAFGNPWVIPGTIVGPGDIAIISAGEAFQSDVWEIVNAEAQKAIAASLNDPDVVVVETTPEIVVSAPAAPKTPAKGTSD